MFAGTLGQQALPLFTMMTRNGGTAAYNERYAKRKDVQAEIAAFREKIKTIKTPEEFMSNFKLMRFALSAFSMESEIDAAGRNKQVLMSDLTDPRSLANRLADPRYREIATAFDFFKSGVKKLSNATFIDTLVKRYVQNEAEQDVGKTSPDVTDALYFRRKIGDVKTTLQLVSDPVLLRVTVDTLNISRASLSMPIKQLTAAIEKKLDMSRLKDSTYVDRFLQRGLALKDMANLRRGGRGLVDMFA